MPGASREARRAPRRPPRQPETDDANALVAPRNDRRRLDSQQPLDVSGHQQRLLEAGWDVRIEPARLGVCGDRLCVEPAVATGMNEPGEQLRIVAMTVGFVQQAHDGSRRLADVRLQIRVELVRHRKSRVDLERLPERLFSVRLALGSARDVLADHPVAATEVRPRRSKPRIQLQAALIHLARLGDARVRARQLVGAEIQRVGAGVVRRIRRGRCHSAPPTGATAHPRRGERCRPANRRGHPAAPAWCATSAAFRPVPRRVAS